MSVVSHDDLPHPLPPHSYLRYKENWFLVIMDESNDIFGAVHVVSEPGFERVRFACHLMIKGQLLQYGNEIAFPQNFAFSPELGDGIFQVRFVKAHEQIDFSLHDEQVDLDVSFLKRSPLFNFDDYDYANPDKVKLREVSGLGAPQQYVHQQQAMFSKGSLTVNTGACKGQAFSIDGLAYRDHSRAMRCDNLTLKHFWTGLHFPSHVFGAMSVTGTLRPSEPADCGYVYDDESGLRSLRQVQIRGSGDGSDGLPALVEFQLTDIQDQPFTITADLTKRKAHVPLQTEKPGATPFIYDIVENFTPLSLKETGETGFGLIEIGWSTPK